VIDGPGYFTGAAYQDNIHGGGPADAFADGELMATTGHARFATGSASEIVLIPGQAAPDISVSATAATRR
jgi:hypothetical protein